MQSVSKHNCPRPQQNFILVPVLFQTLDAV